MENQSLGYEYEGVPMDSVYCLTYTFGHFEDELTLVFSAMGLQSIDDESRGIDNLEVCLRTSTLKRHCYLPIISR